MQETIIKLAGVAAAVGPVLAVGGKLVSGIGSLMQLAPQLVSGFQAVQGALSALWGVMAANPITLIIAAIAALVAAFIYCWNNVEGFKEFFLNAWEAIKKGVSDAAAWIGNAIKDIGNWFSDLGTNALNWGKDLINNFIDGIKSMWDKAKKAVSDFAGMIKDFLGFSEPKKGPLSNFHTYAPDMVDLFVKGLRDNQQQVANQLAQTFALPEQTVPTGTVGAQAGAGEFTTPLAGAQGATIAPVLVLDGQVVGRVLLPSLRNEEYRSRGRTSG
jgi:phage-related protein